LLDSETRRRIDTARDILVGKVPDPKSQVEQITIALIYKFMDDMDAEAEELGGKRSFFVGEYEKFSWGKLMSPAMGGYDVLNLYGEAIDKMTRNEGVPQLFRDIFKNAYLPYRDPETLKLFLKTINEFSYDHSERLGDAFEYLLSVLGSQGDAGQFRTPRHIIDFMVKVVDPQKDESILDPACGTAGFLISAYKHVLAVNAKDGKAGGALKPTERTKLANNIRGYDISPDMVRLSLVNLYLHGFNTPNIFEYDTLTSEERWDEYADVILANPPFMSPKGGIKPHKRFSVSSSRSEVLFVDYMAEHLTPNGRAAFIVPEGIIFQSGTAYKSLRKYLVEENYLWGVVSLPAGVFNPYSGVKTSILLLDRSLAKKTDKVLFVKVETDGFDLGAQRRPIDRNDLPDALNTLHSWHKAVLDGQPDSFVPTIGSALLVSTTRLAENDEYNLSADRYREFVRVGKQTYPMVDLGDICEIIAGQSPEGKYYNDQQEGMPFYQGKTEFTEKYLGAPTTWTTGVTKIAEKNDILMSVRAPVGPVNIATQQICIGRGLAAIRPDESKALMEYVFINLKTNQDNIKGNSGSTFASINKKDIAKLQIPLPPLEIQRQIVDEIAAHQRIIDGARQVVEGWKPNIEFELAEMLKESGLENWEWTTFDEACLFNPKKNEIQELEDDTVVSFVPMEDLNEHMLLFETKKERTKGEVYKGYTYFRDEDVILAKVTPCFENGKSGVARNLTNGIGFGSSEYYVFRSSGKTLPEYIYYLISQQKFLDEGKTRMTGTGGLQRVPKDFVANYQIPLPPLEIQREIVGRIEAERQIVEGNRELIQIYEAKIKQVIARVWEG